MLRSLLLGLAISSFGVSAAQSVTTFGSLRQVKQMGQLAGTVRLDTLLSQSRYGLGPVSDLQGEILLWNDTTYVSRVNEGKNIVDVESAVTAPFFVYASVSEWTDFYPVADSIASLSQLQQCVEQYAVAAGRSLDEPFPFVLYGTVSRLTYHVMDKPKGQTTHSPKLHQQAKRFYTLQSEPVQLLGVYSQQHEGIFTHHGSYIHVHIINQARTKMGHLDQLTALPSNLSVAFPN